ncbi:MAG: thioredoxin domain-containing protein [Pseudomonadota bacterium]
MNQPPGLSRSKEDQDALAAALAAEPLNYVPRTHLKEGDAPRYTNRLIFQASPYLRQHAHNPVDWWPWGAEALAAATKYDKPIFLSAGYATCHWCHVMEDESFDNEAVAALLNAHFIPIKLDREERPDVDQTYILATQFQNQHAGWPNSVWALPDGRPFHTGTYFQRGHFMQILDAIAKAWNSEKRAEFLSFADRLSTAVATAMARGQPETDLTGIPEKGALHLVSAHNPDHGGFSTGQQFPNEVNHLFLLDQARRGDKDAMRVTLHSLDHIAAGGLQDQVGGGFHRYTVDVNWRTPHFEKMLYNQALLMRCFTEAWSITTNPVYARAVDRCATYVLRDMVDAEGAFFAAEDADSLDAEGHLEEGAFYAWTWDSALPLIGDTVARQLGIDQEATIPAGSVPHLKPGAIDNAEALDRACEILRAARASRPKPFRDEKILLGWNGLMIASLADAGLIFERPTWIDAADRAFSAIMQKLRDQDRWIKLAQGTPADLTDLIWAADAALALFSATGTAGHLITAEALAREALLLKTETSRLAMSMDGPIGPVFELDDGAMPAGESSALRVFADLATLTGDLYWQTAHDDLLSALSGHIAAAPTARPMALRSIAEKMGTPTRPVQVLPQRSGAAVLREDGLHLLLTDGHTATSNTARIGENNVIPRPEASGPWTIDLEICSDQICYPRFELKVFLP